MVIDNNNMICKSQGNDLCPFRTSLERCVARFCSCAAADRYLDRKQRPLIGGRAPRPSREKRENQKHQWKDYIPKYSYCCSVPGGWDVTVPGSLTLTEPLLELHFWSLIFCSTFYMQYLMSLWRNASAKWKETTTWLYKGEASVLCGLISCWLLLCHLAVTQGLRQEGATVSVFPAHLCRPPGAESSSTATCRGSKLGCVRLQVGLCGGKNTWSCPFPSTFSLSQIYAC